LKKPQLNEKVILYIIIVVLLSLVFFGFRNRGSVIDQLNEVANHLAQSQDRVNQITGELGKQNDITKHLRDQLDEERKNYTKLKKDFTSLEKEYRRQRELYKELRGVIEKDSAGIGELEILVDQGANLINESIGIIQGDRKE